jgi:glucan phosphoethanolaminetransferase (alkaline phosphatase superfamily)
MNTSKAAITVSLIIGKVCSFFGYFFAIGYLFMIVAIIGEGSIGQSDKTAMIITFLLMSACGVLLIRKGISNKNRIRRFRTYVGLISDDHMTSLESIASSTSKSVDFVRNDLQKMINKKFFQNAYIDLNADKIVIVGMKQKLQTTEAPQPAEQDHALETYVKCSGCGATNLKKKGVAAYCEYCGSPLK